MVCKIDSLTGNLLGKFKASTKSISCMTVSSDGKRLVTAAAQLKTFDCSNHKKIHKFMGHPRSIRCMIFTENGKFILSSAVAERYIAVWKAEDGKKQFASCVLAMDHPAVFIDSICDNEEIYVFAISETGVYYFLYAQDVETLCNAKPTKLSISSEDDGFIKINVDGAMVSGWNKGGIGGLIRDNRGVLIHWFSDKVGGPPIMAKLLAIKRGLYMLSDSGVGLNKRIILESDSGNALKWIKNLELSSPMFISLVKEIVSIMEGKDITLRQILRATNWEADRLAKDGI
ncbi:uncharacterized protein LOC120198861 [Hibiscus syriacus]|uniref:uncharacterized protein LOC120198861 n=1 Tax=Hibiscus syriacus TaxID=106335 RepID=UPI001921AC8C|nr:uncharacterized protein LOC120198861 [Hibiscus syriacus]